MRTAGQARLGFYPTPDRVMHILKTWIAPHPDGWSVLDPCCGTGVARILGAPYTYGIEIEHNRAQAARDGGGFTQVITGAIESARVPLKSLSVLYLNPPYDDGVAIRMELDFLRRATPWLQPNGLLLFVVSGPRVRNLMASYLAQRYELVGCWRFPDPDYADYGQVVVVARKRSVPLTNGVSGVVYTKAVATAPVLDVRGPCDDPWLVPPGHPDGIRGAAWAPAELLADLATTQHGGWSAVYRKSAQNAAPSEVITTPLTLHRGHLAIMLAAGQVRGVIGTGDLRHAVKGRVRIETVIDTKSQSQSDGTLTTIAVTRTVHRVDLTVIRADGAVVHLLSSVPQAMEDAEEGTAE